MNSIYFFLNEDTKNEFYQVLSPNPDDEGVWIHQNAWFHIGSFDKGVTTKYDLKDKSNGVYAFILEGNATIAGEALAKRDGFGIWETPSFEVTADSDTRILLMEVPMNL